MNYVLREVQKEISQKAGRCFGYRLMHQKLRLMGCNVDRETVRLCIKAVDPEGVKDRARHKLIRRIYKSAGPNFLWYVDGYDKLKPFGFPIHGAIDGYSRKMLWLNVATSNNDPKIVAHYYLKTIERSGGQVPRCIRSDRGSENVIICGIQRYFRRTGADSAAGKKSFLYGPSTPESENRILVVCFQAKSNGILDKLLQGYGR